MQNTIQMFESDEFGSVRVVQRDGQPWWVLKDICGAIGIRNVTDTAKRLDSDEKADFDSIEVSSNGTKQRRKRVIISESGLYAVILRSDKPNAREFRKWITSSVLPAIRQHGAYITRETLERMQEDSNFAEELLERLATEHAKNRTLTDYVEKLQPKAQYYDEVLQSDRAIPATLIAKDYGMTTIAFNKLLHALEVQYRIGPTWYLYKEYADRGYTVTKTYFVGKKKVSVHTAWTQRGRAFLYDLLKWYGILPNAEPAEAA